MYLCTSVLGASFYFTYTSVLGASFCFTYTSVLGASLYFVSRMTVAQERDRDLLIQVKHAICHAWHMYAYIMNANAYVQLRPTLSHSHTHIHINIPYTFKKKNSTIYAYDKFPSGTGAEGSPKQGLIACVCVREQTFV